MRLQAILLYAAGGLTIIIAAMHVGLPALWGWYSEIKQLSPKARKTIIDRNSFLILLLLLIAYLAFALNADLQFSATGRALLLMMGLFWIFRALWRLVGYPKDGVTLTMAILYFINGMFFLIALIP